MLKTESKKNNVHSSRDHERDIPTIVLYSPDMDFCMSLRLLLQDRYYIVTTTDIKVLLTMVHSFEPTLVIVDSPPTEAMKRRFDIMKEEYPEIRIMFFYASLFNNQLVRNFVRESVDAAFSKPIDLTEVMNSINELVSLHA
jgi:hypothetical protein